MKKIILSAVYDGRLHIEEFVMKDDAKDWEIEDESCARALDFALAVSSIASYANLPFGGRYLTPADNFELNSSLDYEWSIEEVDE